LMEHGIWYPGIWDDYLKEHPVPQIRQQSANNHAALLQMRDFYGFRRKNKKLHIEEQIAYSGERITGVGEDGAGKSTLLLSIMRVLRTEGYCESDEYEGTRVREAASKAALVFQNPELQFVANTVLEEVSASAEWLGAL